MRGKDLYEKFTDIDDDIIAEVNDIDKCKGLAKTKKPIYFKWAIVAASFSILILSGLFYIGTKDVSPTDDSYVFTLVAYAAESEEDILTANYINETDATVLKSGVETMLASYTPLMSSVPGFPFTANFTAGASATITVSVDNGEILEWNQESGAVYDLDEETLITSGSTFYWSPLSGDNEICESAVITITVKDGENIVAIHNVKIISQDDIYYATIDKMNIQQ